MQVVYQKGSYKIPFSSTPHGTHLVEVAAMVGQTIFHPTKVSMCMNMFSAMGGGKREFTPRSCPFVGLLPAPTTIDSHPTIYMTVY